MIVAFIAVLITAGSLSAQPAASLPPLPADLDIRTLTIRAAKDSVLRHGADSPLLATDRDDFGGLAYYTLEPKHRLIGELYRFGQPRQIHLPTNADETISMERFGRLKWQWQGKDFWFEVYRNPSVETLEVFFKDTTNGDQNLVKDNPHFFIIVGQVLTDKNFFTVFYDEAFGFVVRA